MDIVNENKLYQVINRFFTDPRNLLGELIQNACRAKADKIEILMGKEKEYGIPGDYTLYIQDNGTGINDLKALLGIAYSDWDAAVENQEPAGMGFLQLVASAYSVKVHSAFGYMFIDCDRFLNDAEYRRKLISRKQKPDPKRKGTTILAELKQPANQHMYSDKSYYSGYDAALTLNGEPIQPCTLTGMVEYARNNNTPYKLLYYKDNPLFVTFREMFDYQYYNRQINWYGQYIPLSPQPEFNKALRIYYEVRTGTPLTPLYPDRVKLCKDDKFKDFMNFVNKELAAFIAEYLLQQTPDAVQKDPSAPSLLHAFYSLCTPEEAQALPWLPVSFDPCDYSDYRLETPALKSALQDYAFCVAPLHIDDDYRFSGGLPCKVVLVKDTYRNLLSDLGLRELTNIQRVESEYGPIIQKPLKLKLSYGTGVEELCEIETAMLSNYNNNYFVYGRKAGDIYNIFIEHYENLVGAEDSPDSFETQQEYALQDFRSEYEQTFSVVSRRNFYFLPNSGQIKTIHFAEKRLQVTYANGECQDFVLETL